MRRPLGVNVVPFELGQEFAKQLRIFGLDMILAHAFSLASTPNGIAQLKRRLAVRRPYSDFSLFVDGAWERLRSGNRKSRGHRDSIELRNGKTLR
jgi:hypothetical protein